jgi:hypothetical protein
MFHAARHRRGAQMVNVMAGIAFVQTASAKRT